MSAETNAGPEPPKTRAVSRLADGPFLNYPRVARVCQVRDAVYVIRQELRDVLDPAVAAAEAARAIARPDVAAAAEARSSPEVSAQKDRDEPVGDERPGVGEKSHVGELDRRPPPAAGLAPHDGDRRDALHREREEDEEGDRAAGVRSCRSAALQAFDVPTSSIP